MRLLQALLILALCAVICACAGKPKIGRSGGVKPYTIKGKTYYPLKSAHGYTEEGMASWYGPGFHGKTTANGERYNQNAMTAAHKILPLNSNVMVTHLGNGRSVQVRINDRGPFVDNRIIDLSKAAADALAMRGAGTARVRIQSVGASPAIAPDGDVKGSFYIQAGAFGQKKNAEALAVILARAGNRGRLIFGENNLWNVQVGPWQDSETAGKFLSSFKLLYPSAFVINAN